jgi:DNA-binding MarR family transcriptional regulator
MAYARRVPEDHVDRILEQWRRERTDLDLTGMAIIGRVSRLARTIQPRLDAVFAQHGLESWEFDVLATLRRTGAPYQLSAGQLLSSMMITSGAVTNRLDRLEARGLIKRKRDPSDGRLVLATLTRAGLTKIDAAVADHAANEAKLVGPLDAKERQDLQRLLRRLYEAISAGEA